MYTVYVSSKPLQAKDAYLSSAVTMVFITHTYLTQFLFEVIQK